MKAHDVEPELLGVDTGAPALPPSCLGHGPRVCVLLAYARALMLARPRLRCLGSLGVCVCACQLSCATPSQQHTFRVFCWRLPLGREVVNPLTGERLPVRPPAASCARPALVLIVMGSRHPARAWSHNLRYSVV